MTAATQPTKHNDGFGWYKTVLKHLFHILDEYRWYKTVLYHLNPSLCFVGNERYDSILNLVPGVGVRVCSCAEPWSQQLHVNVTVTIDALSVTSAVDMSQLS